jgi:hypothetical protein
VRTLLLKLHMYAGLLTVSHLLVYAIAGLVATLETTRPEPPRFSTAYVPFAAPPSAGDEQVAEAAWRTAHLPLTFPLDNSELQRDNQQNLVLEYYTVNGVDRITVLQREHRLRVEQTHSGLLQFLNDLHTAMPGDWKKPRLMAVWAWWNEFAAWCLGAFTVSGVLLWIMSRGARWAAALLIAGIALFVGMRWLLG